MKKKPKPMKPGRGWAWAFQEITVSGAHNGRWVLCNWATTSREGLLSESPPTSDAKPVYVEIRPVRRTKRKP